MRILIFSVSNFHIAVKEKGLLVNNKAVFVIP